MTRGLARVSARLSQRWDTDPARGATVLAHGYLALVRARDQLYRHRALRSRAVPCGVVSIGNLTVGGTGKTPAVIHVVETLRRLGARPAVVSRGYGRRSRGVRVVTDGRSLAAAVEDAGDEPFLLARRLTDTPVVVGEDRYRAARQAVEQFGVTAIVLDDGFQHRGLVKDLEIVLTRGARPWGNGWIVPAGPLREPLDALRRADLIVATGDDRAASLAAVEPARDRYAPDVPLLWATQDAVESWEAHDPSPAPATALSRRRLVAFAGIADPFRFRHSLAALEVTVAAFERFPDHHWYVRADLERLGRLASALDADGLVTTEKDWVRLHGWARPDAPLYVLATRFVLQSGESEWEEALQRVAR